MKGLIKIMLTLALIFASTFVIANSTGFLSIDKIEQWLAHARAVSPHYIAAIVVGLLFADLFIAVPTLTIIILSGFFLGPLAGFAAAVTGLFASGIGGYSLSILYGDRLSRFLIKDPAERQSAKNAFLRHGFLTILMSRAMPILPEVSACMAGITRMPFLKFLLAWTISAVPYAAVATYAGSVSSLDNPKPAIVTAVGLTVFFWWCWFLFRRHLTQSALSQIDETRL